MGVIMSIFQLKKKSYKKSVEWVKENANHVDTLTESRGDEFFF